MFSIQGGHQDALDPSLYISRGLLYAQLAQFELAEADFKQAQLLDTKQSISSYAIDLAELQRNNAGGALSQIRSQLKAHPDSALLHYLLAKLLTSQGSDTDSKVSQEALQAALVAVKLNPKLVEARDLLASIYTRTGEYALAIEQCQLALQQSPADESAIYHLIVALRHSGQAEQRDQIPALVKRLSDLKGLSLQQETDRKRFKLVEAEAAPPAK